MSLWIWEATAYIATREKYQLNDSNVVVTGKWWVLTADYGYAGYIVPHHPRPASKYNL